MSKNLIALVATAVVIDGQRTIVQPGHPLPDLSPHDAHELVQSGAAEDPAVTASKDKADASAAAETAKEFQAARSAALAAQASTVVDADTATAKKPAKAPAK